MPRNFEKKRPIDATRLERLTGAVNAVKNNPMSIRKAAAEFNVNRCSIERRLKKEVGGVGRATVLSVMEERMLAKLINDVAEGGFPLGKIEIKTMVKSLLDIKGMKSRSSNNRPGDDWFDKFKKRNKLSQRLASNIKIARASVDAESVNLFFDKLEASGIGEIKPENLFNYDETNFVNDTGKSWVVVRRGRRRVEKASNDSKQSFSLMCCGSATGEMMPPMVVYGKVKNLYENWKYFSQHKFRLG